MFVFPPVYYVLNAQAGRPESMKSYIEKLIRGESLSGTDALFAMSAVMDGEATPAQIGALLTALRMKGETPEEIAGFARAMRDRAIRVHTSRQPLVDTCGTGGASFKTFNISTTAAFIVAASGVAVAKHGNRAATSKCGSADVLEALGVRLDISADMIGKGIDSVGMGFLFARAHHPAMKNVAPVRAELGVRTVFNFLGPLTNPAGATRQVMGVADAAWVEPLARVLASLGAEHALVVHGGGLDEISTFGETLVAEAQNGQVRCYTITPDDLGLPIVDAGQLAPGEDIAENARLLTAVLENEDPGSRRDIALANAAAALYVAGVATTLREGVAIARETLKSGAARVKLEELRRYTQQSATEAQ